MPILLCVLVLPADNMCRFQAKWAQLARNSLVRCYMAFVWWRNSWDNQLTNHKAGKFLFCHTNRNIVSASEFVCVCATKQRFYAASACFGSQLKIETETETNCYHQSAEWKQKSSAHIFVVAATMVWPIQVAYLATLHWPTSKAISCCLCVCMHISWETATHNTAPVFIGLKSKYIPQQMFDVIRRRRRLQR